MSARRLNSKAQTNLFASKKAQTSIEFLFVTVIVLTLSIVIISGFAQTNNSTAGMAVLRSLTVSELAKENAVYYLEKIEGPVFDANGNPTFTIKISGNHTITLDLKNRIEDTGVKILADQGVYTLAKVIVQQA